MACNEQTPERQSLSFRIYRTIKIPPHPFETRHSFPNLTSNADSLIQDENDDYCSSCGGNGVLVCCDGCTRAFHYKCIDPPMSEDALPDSAWYCNVCDSKVNPPMVDDESGSFGLLLAHLHRKNPSAFHLPKDIREYFDNVKTGAEGEYEEPVQPKAKYVYLANCVIDHS